MSWEKQKERDKKEIWNGKNLPKNNKQKKQVQILAYGHAPK